MKKNILKELGEDELLLPELVNAALAANDRIKYYFTLLQAARSSALHPDNEFPGLIARILNFHNILTADERR
jgi:hypothetical protein